MIMASEGKLMKKKKSSHVLSQKLSKLSKKMRAKDNLKFVDPRMLNKEES